MEKGTFVYEYVCYLNKNDIFNWEDISITKHKKYAIINTEYNEMRKKYESYIHFMNWNKSYCLDNDEIGWYISEGDESIQIILFSFCGNMDEYFKKNVILHLFKRIVSLKEEIED